MYTEINLAKAVSPTTILVASSCRFFFCLLELA